MMEYKEECKSYLSTLRLCGTKPVKGHLTVGFIFCSVDARLTDTCGESQPLVHVNISQVSLLQKGLGSIKSAAK